MCARVPKSKLNKTIFEGSALNKPIKWFIWLPEQNGYYPGGMPVVLSAWGSRFADYLNYLARC